MPGLARAHDGAGKIRGSCEALNIGGKATVTVTVENLWSDSIHNLAPSELMGSSSGSATFFLQTSPRPLRELLPNKHGQLVWKGRYYGDGLLDLSVQVGGEFDDGETSSTGIVNCNRVTIGNPDPGEPPTATPGTDEPSPTNTAGEDTPIPTASAGRPTRTPIEPRPTRTPRDNPTDTPLLEQPTSTHTRTQVIRPTRTPIEARPTRTPVVRATRTPIEARQTPIPRPTRTPIEARPTRTPIVRATRTPIPIPTAPPRTNTPTRVLPTRTPTLGQPTRTPIPLRPTRTPVRPPTPRPTRTPNVAPPTPTRVPPIIGDGLVANCSLRRNVDFVTVTMIVENRSGLDLRDVGVSTLQLDPEGGTLFFDRTGPSPSSVPQLRNGASASFQWTGRLSTGGTMGFSSFATANSPAGPLQTRLADCGVTGANGGSFDPTSFSGDCSIHASEDGEISVQITNGTGEPLTNVAAFFVSKSATGSAGVFDIRGPAPRNVTTLTPGGGREFVFSGKFLGEGTVTMRFEGRGHRPNTQGIDTALIECSADLGGSGGGLPDLGVDSDDLQNSLLIETQNFGQDSCAVQEGCVDGTGQRKLLRFNTVTPNYGPGDVFFGDPEGNPQFVFGACHGHFHFDEYADYRLLDTGGNIVARGHKQAFCLVDLWQLPGGGGDPRPQFPTCEFQGISAGWADVYHRGLDCQWIDITGVPAGRYVVEVHINPARVIHETNYQNNVGRAEVVIP